MGYLKATKEHDVPRTTLFCLASSTEAEDAAGATTLSCKTMFASAVGDLVDHCLLMVCELYGLTRRDVRLMAYQLDIKNNISKSFGASRIAGKDWLKIFLRRHEN
ncbi:hypothetical protein PR048_007502 [Dryococelus australis]|uniref:Uncharacterized protein n=1 Tax=Dryococelus australis TaxID=614101 RepID=A0ABQ9HUE4_9NEOP|nr:hypothetical protein PR048_007502 [Dryococelus australis]